MSNGTSRQSAVLKSNRIRTLHSHTSIGIAATSSSSRSFSRLHKSGTLRVCPEAWKRATAFAAQVERCIFQLLPTGMSAVGFDLQRIEERIREGGRGGITQNKLTRCFQSMPMRDRNEKIQTLIEAGAIIRIDDLPTSGKGGRPK